MTEEQFNETIEGTTEQRDIAIRETSNGFILGGTSRYVDETTGAVRLVRQSEAIATVYTAVVEEVKNFLGNGKFGK